MSLGFGFNSGLRALTAAQLGIQTAGQNVANANTPGYSRQRVLQVSSAPFYVGRGFPIGTGVDVADVQRLFDSGLTRRIWSQGAALGAAEVGQRQLLEIESVLGEPDNGLSLQLADLFGRLGDLQTDPADRSLRGGAIQAAQSLTGQLHLLDSRLGELSSGTFEEVRGLVATVNERASRVAELNVQIVAAEAGGATANELRDERDRLVEELSGDLDVRALERGSGAIDLIAGGHVLVGGDRVAALGVGRTATGGARVTSPSGGELDLRTGRIGGLLALERSGLGDVTSRLDRLARELALAFNREHTIGVPGSGPLQQLLAHRGVDDSNANGVRGDELLADSGLPFDIARGELFVTVTNRETGELARTRLTIDPTRQTLQDLAASLAGIANLDATVDPDGRLRVTADAGFGFDFSPRLDPTPNAFGGLGGTRPALGTNASGPFDVSGLTFPATFTVDVDGTAEVVTLAATDFADPAAATAAELATAIDDDLSIATARAIGGRVVVRSDSAGSSTTLSLVDGTNTPLSALGFALGPATGQDLGVDVELGGSYTGTSNGSWTFVADRDGEIGRTPGLTISVYDERGARVATLDVGDGYEVGRPLTIADGVTVEFSHGAVSATNNEVFAADVLADSDTSDILVALELNTFFVGSTAADLDVHPDLLADPLALAAGSSLAAGDGSILDALVGLRDRGQGGLDSVSFEDFYGSLVSDVGFETAAAISTHTAQQQLGERLAAERERVAGVNLDEEMVDLVRYQQAYEAAARFLETVQSMTSTLINLGN